MRRRVHLHGAYAGFHPGPVEIVADTVWEAVEAVTHQLRGFRPDAISGRKRLQVVGYPTIESLKKRDEVEDIHVFPALSFGKNGGVIQTIIGVALIVVGIALGGVFWPTIFISMGMSMVIGGVMQVLSPQPTLNGNSNDAEVKSKYLGAIANTVKIGTTIALPYGRGRVGGQILSLQIDAKDTGL